MQRWLGSHADRTYLLFRLIVGVLFASHGAQKLFGAFGGQVMTSNRLMLAAGLLELVAGLLVAIGLAASWAAFVACGEMAVAYFMVHAQHGFWPLVNKGELAVLYCFAFLFIAARGAGGYSLDAGMRRR